MLLPKRKKNITKNFYRDLLSKRPEYMSIATTLRCAIWHEYCAIHTLTLPKCRTCMVTKKCFILFASNVADYWNRLCNLLEEK